MPKKATGDAGKRTTKKTATKRSTAKAKTAKAKTAKAKTATAKAARRKVPKQPAAEVAAVAAPAGSGGTRLRVRQVRSGIGRAATYRRTLRALGLRHHQDEVVVADTASMRGMLHKVRHLVRVTPEEA